MAEPISIILSLLLTAQAAETPASQMPSDTPTETPTTQTAALEEEVDDDDKIVCRRTAVIGSKFKKKLCGTKKQWETLENRSAETTQTWQRRGKGLEPNDTNSPGG